MPTWCRWTTILEDLGAWLSSIGVEELNDYLEASSVPRIDETVELLINCLKIFLH